MNLNISMAFSSFVSRVCSFILSGSFKGKYLKSLSSLYLDYIKSVRVIYLSLNELMCISQYVKQLM